MNLLLYILAAIWCIFGVSQFFDCLNRRADFMLDEIKSIFKRILYALITIFFGGPVVWVIVLLSVVVGCTLVPIIYGINWTWDKNKHHWYNFTTAVKTWFTI